MSDQESVILPHRNIQSSSGTLRFQLFSDVLYNFVSFHSLLRFGFQTYHYSSLSVSYRSSCFCDSDLLCVLNGASVHECQTAHSFLCLFLMTSWLPSTNLFSLAVVHHKFVPIFLRGWYFWVTENQVNNKTENLYDGTKKHQKELHPLFCPTCYCPTFSYHMSDTRISVRPLTLFYFCVTRFLGCQM